MKWMNIAISEARKSYKKKETPVGVVLVKDNKVITKSHNKREKNNNVLGHAEIIAILKCSKKLNTWKLDDVDMYVTLRPCSMCERVIKESRIKNVYYLIDRDESKKDYNKTNICLCNNVESDEINDYQSLLSKFFKNIRK